MYDRWRTAVTTETMQAIWGSSRADAWFKAVNAIIADNDWEAFNLVVEIANATNSSRTDHEVETAVNDFLVRHNAQPLETVAETIFPASEYSRYGTEGVYSHYPNKVYPEIKDGSWGTYAHRLVRRELAGDGTHFNPLEECVEKIRKQLTKPSTFRSCYELDIFDSQFELHTYNAVTDRKRFRSGPCLSHLSLKINGCKRLLLTATYRYHYYIERFLGNMLGLAQLQRFICDETELNPGPIVCVSTFAKVDTGPSWTRKELREFIHQISEKSGWTIPDRLAQQHTRSGRT